MEQSKILKTTESAGESSSFHNKHIFDGNQLKFICLTCSEIFYKFTELLNHLPIHNKPKHFNCVICAKSYLKCYSLKQHM